MEIQCPKCQLTSRIDDSKIPENGVHTRCKRCETRFFISKPPKPEDSDGKNLQPERFTCPQCKHDQAPSAKCVYCGHVFPEFIPTEPPKSTDKPKAVKPEPVRPQRPNPLVHQDIPDVAICPFCDETIRSKAKKCKHCGEILTQLPDQGERKPKTMNIMKGLFDLSFNERITPHLIRSLYSVYAIGGAAIAMIGCGLLFYMEYPIPAILCPLAYFTILVAGRIYSEVFLTLLRIENSRKRKNTIIKVED